MWTKLFSLTYLDPPLWLQNAFRFADGQMPYRDYSYPYPALGIAFIGWAFRLFGVKFTVAQMVMDVISLGIVIAVFALVRQLMPRALQALTCILMIAVCATAQSYFSLFSLLGYTPSLQVAALGLLLLMLGGFRYLDRGHFEAGNVALMAIGSAVALLSKQEPMLVVPGFLALLAVCDRKIWFRDRSFPDWLRTYLWLGCACIVPSVVIMIPVIARAGLHNFAAAIRGYGLATIPCPWWPTGRGVFAACAAVGDHRNHDDHGRYDARAGHRYVRSQSGNDRSRNHIFRSQTAWSAREFREPLTSVPVVGSATAEPIAIRATFPASEAVKNIESLPGISSKRPSARAGKACSPARRID